MFSSLDRGDGTCKFFDDAANNCTIYEDRPTLCNVEATYDLLHSKGNITKQQYFDIASGVCNHLKDQAGYTSLPKAIPVTNL